MKKEIFNKEYPIYSHVFTNEESPLQTVDAYLAYFEKKISAHPIATYIATFNHYEHTMSLSEGKVAANIKDAKNIVFCFGKDLSKPEVLALRPRSIGVTQTDDGFHIAFMQAPNEMATKSMITWIEGLIKS